LYLHTALLVLFIGKSSLRCATETIKLLTYLLLFVWADKALEDRKPADPAKLSKLALSRSGKNFIKNSCIRILIRIIDES